jgi:aminoglycoside phosphotransferase (APT) family kinase protein
MSWLESIAEAQRDAAREAVTNASLNVHRAEQVLGGASGALTYRLDSNNRSYLMRMETRRSPMRNPHQYTCMKIAAEAGVAPALRYESDAAGVAIMDFVEKRPLAEYPGGAVGLAEGLGRLAARLQETERFPVLADYRVIVERIMERVKSSFAAGLLDRHLEGFARIKAAYPWDAAEHVSSHNDPNTHNVLFDGERLWLIDWETSFRNDRYTDIAVLSDHHGATAEFEEAMLRAWLGREPDRAVRSRVFLMRQMTRLYYAGLLLMISGATGVTDMDAPTQAEFGAMLGRGEVKPADPATMAVLGKMCLASFAAALDDPRFVASLEVCQH